MALLSHCPRQRPAPQTMLVVLLQPWLVQLSEQVEALSQLMRVPAQAAVLPW